MRYLLDTNIVIASSKGHPLVRAKLEQMSATALILSPIVLGELLLGVEKSIHRAANDARVRAIAAQMQVVVVDANCSAAYATIRAALERGGTPIGRNDLWIAAQAFALGATLVTDNTREFERVAGLRVENWLSATAP